ncbi:MAG TPA: PepSY domain-containing protein [Longimicrobium sp.]|jgi:uncharacterized membrane protein YkoI|nr:PepSY domain-containing protein [Longimicrobium sp.]
MKHLATLAAAAILSVAAASGAAAQHRPAHETQAQLQRQARVTEAQARATALATVPRGQVKSGELEREHGQLIYSFDISVPGRSGIEEVQVNAVNGRIVSHVHETPAAERGEARAEHREHAPAAHPKP